MTRIGILGGSGRMGRAIAAALRDSAEARLAGASVRGENPGDLARACDVLVDFSSPDALAAHLDAALAAGRAIVIGTTGLGAEHQRAIDGAADKIAVLVGANMSLGVNLLALLVGEAAGRLGDDWDVEIVEMHHRHKVDAPSGTALMLGEAAAAARGAKLDAVAERGRDGAAGPRAAGRIGFAALRGGTVAGDHLVVFAGEGERIEIGHRAESRDIFAQGAIRAALWLAGRPPGRYAMADVLGSEMKTAPPGELARRLGLFDATMLVMGGIIGAGIFVNPAEVARHVASPTAMVGAWLIGGAIALAGALVYAELAARRPETGGQYAYLRDAWGPIPAFLYGWSLLLVIQSGGMAAVAITFALYFAELTGTAINHGAIAAAALALLTAINCLGVRAGANVQGTLMVLKIAAIAGLVLAGLLLAPAAPASAPRAGDAALPLGLLAALTPVMFAYGGWQTSSFVAGEMRDPRRDLARGLLLGVGGVILLYAAVAFVCVQVLGSDGLAATQTPASAVMRAALGERGADLIALGIAISALGFLSQGMLTTPRVYHAMAADGLFFRRVAAVSPRTQAPVPAILLQGAAATIIALSGSYGQILSYVVSVDFLWFGLTGAALLVFRRREPASAGFAVPGHPAVTLLFVAACWLVAAATIWNAPANSAIGLLILLAGVPAGLFWLRRRA